MVDLGAELPSSSRPSSDRHEDSLSPTVRGQRSVLARSACDGAERQWPGCTKRGSDQSIHPAWRRVPVCLPLFREELKDRASVSMSLGAMTINGVVLGSSLLGSGRARYAAAPFLAALTTSNLSRL